jgi:hypothetical protein
MLRGQEKGPATFLQQAWWNHVEARGGVKVVTEQELGYPNADHAAANSRL